MTTRQETACNIKRMNVIGLLGTSVVSDGVQREVKGTYHVL